MRGTSGAIWVGSGGLCNMVCSKSVVLYQRRVASREMARGAISAGLENVAGGPAGCE
mgnify:CR=1 FL=1